MPATTDEELMLRFAQGDDSAFVGLLQKFKPRLAEFAMQILHDRETAEDITQEAFLRAFKAKDSYRPIAKFSTWIYTIVTNLCYDELRKHRRQVSLESMLRHPPTDEDVVLRRGPTRRPSPPGPDVQAEQNELACLIDEVVQSLSPEHRQVISLRIHQGLGYAEAAARLGCSVGTAKSRMHYAVKNLREGLMKRM